MLEKKYKLGLVQTNDIIGTNIILPLAIGILWESANSNIDISSRWTLVKKVWSKENTNNDIEQLKDCDIVAFSNYEWNFDYHCSLAREIKKKNPNCFILFGGPYITPNFLDFYISLDGVVDLSIVGEGDISFTNLLKQWPNVEIEKIPGAWTKDYFNGNSARLSDLTMIASPYLCGFYDDIIDIETANGRKIQAVLQTNRGCPYHCTFCEQGDSYKNKMFFRDFDTICKEIDWIGQKNIEYLTISDDNWGIRQTDVDLTKVICETKLKYGFPKVMDLTFAKNSPDRILSIVKLDKEYNTKLIRGVTISAQSNNAQTLSAIKRINLVPYKQKQFITELKKLQAPTYSELIWPLPYETYDTLCAGFDNLIDQGLDNWVGMYPLALQYSTNLFNDFKDDYIWNTSKKEKSKPKSSQVKMNIPIANKWVTSEEVIQGHMFYCWMAVLYFFGFARDLIHHAHQDKNTTPSKFINLFIDYTKTTTGTIANINLLLEEYWKHWFNQEDFPRLSIFDSDVDFWYPYTHLASHLQLNFSEYLTHILSFAKDLGLESANEQIEQIEHNTVIYGKSYPYTTTNFEVALDHTPPKFNNLYEFCRYYYWWKRKGGASRTIKSSIKSMTYITK